MPHAEERMNKYPDLFISGMPACGKTTFGKWLEEKYGYKHFDFEKIRPSLLEQHPSEMGEFVNLRIPKKLIDSLIREGAPIVFNWGFPVSRIDTAASIANQILPVWFCAEPAIAEKRFKKRGGQPVSEFREQVSDLSIHKVRLDAVFRGNTIEMIDGSGSFLEFGTAFQRIKEFEPDSPHNGGAA